MKWNENESTTSTKKRATAVPEFLLWPGDKASAVLYFPIQKAGALDLHVTWGWPACAWRGNIWMLKLSIQFIFLGDHKKRWFQLNRKTEKNNCFQLPYHVPTTRPGRQRRRRDQVFSGLRLPGQDSLFGAGAGPEAVKLWWGKRKKKARVEKKDWNLVMFDDVWWYWLIAWMFGSEMCWKW